MKLKFKRGEKVKRGEHIETIIALDEDDHPYLITCSIGDNGSSFCNQIKKGSIEYFENASETHDFKIRYSLNDITFPKDKWYEWVKEGGIESIDSLESVIMLIRNEVANERIKRI